MAVQCGILDLNGENPCQFPPGHQGPCSWEIIDRMLATAENQEAKAAGISVAVSGVAENLKTSPVSQAVQLEYFPMEMHGTDNDTPERFIGTIVSVMNIKFKIVGYDAEKEVHIARKLGKHD